MGRIYISAGHKSSGKTTLSIGLCAALSQQGKKVQAFKKGPDYIDPLWLANASSIRSQRQCYNLDFNTQSSAEIMGTLDRYGKDADICIIEGNKGLHDGVALDGSDSNAAMAKLTKSPVILIIDSRGVTRGVAPLLLGYQCFDTEVQIVGVIYNFCGGSRHEQKLRAVTEEYTDIPVLGMLRKSKSMDLAERHLGLMPSNETRDANQRISEISQFVTGSVDLSKVMDCANSATDLAINNKQWLPNIKANAKTTDKAKVRIGICEDAAFGFYYADDKQALIDAGAELVSINTIEDEALPKNLDGLFIGGGFPETQMQALEDNVSMRDSVYAAIESGLPTYAECGGLMYLSESIHWKNQSTEMVGIIPANAIMHSRPQGRGYVQLEETSDMPWRELRTNASQQTQIIHAHEFHYSALQGLKKKGKFAYKVIRGNGITGENDGWVYKNLIANYSHMRHTENYPWANRFVEFVQSKVNTRVKLINQSIQSSELEL